MSRPAKFTLAASVLVSGLTVWGVHYMQEREREVMYRGVERDEERQAEKKRKRLLDLQINQEKEAAYQKIQPTAAAASSGTSSSSSSASPPP
jgi:protein PET117